MLETFRDIVKSIVPARHHPAVRRTLDEQKARLRHGFNSIRYTGFRHECPVCGGRFRRFPEAAFANCVHRQCPRCDSIDRFRLVYLFLRDETELFTRPMKLLHVAPEPCYQRAFRRSPGLDYVSADRSSAHASVKLDLTEIPFGDESFDAILCSHVLEHIQDDRKAIREMYRVLKPGGFAVLQVPVDENYPTTYEDPSIVDPAQRAQAFRQFDHVRICGLDYGERLSEAGFQVRVVDYLERFDAQTRERFGLSQADKINYCLKEPANRTPGA